LNRQAEALGGAAPIRPGALVLLAVLCMLPPAPGRAAEQETPSAVARLAILPFEVSGALEYENVGPLVPDMLASRMSSMGHYRFMDTIALRKERGAAPSGALSEEEAARLATRFEADFVIAGTIRRSGGVTVLSAQPYARDGSSVGERIVVPVVTLEDLLPKMEPLAEALASRIRPRETPPAGPGP